MGALGRGQAVTPEMQAAGEVVSVLPLTVAAHPHTGKKRLCINGRPLTDPSRLEEEHVLKKQSFKLEQVWQAAGQMRRTDWMLAIDFKSGFLGIPLKPFFRRILCFEWQGQLTSAWSCRSASRRHCRCTRR